MNQHSAIYETLMMSGYAFYVWLAFGVTIFCLLASYFYIRRRLKCALNQQASMSIKPSVDKQSNQEPDKQSTHNQKREHHETRT